MRQRRWVLGFKESCQSSYSQQGEEAVSESIGIPVLASQFTAVILMKSTLSFVQGTACSSKWVYCCHSNEDYTKICFKDLQDWNSCSRKPVYSCHSIERVHQVLFQEYTRLQFLFQQADFWLSFQWRVQVLFQALAVDICEIDQTSVLWWILQ